MAAFSRDGRRVVTASEDGTARVWDTDLPGGHDPRKGRWHVSVLGASPLLHVGLSRDGRRIAANGYSPRQGGFVGVWDTLTGGEAVPPLRHPSINTFAFGADGNTLVTACGDGTTRIWDLSKNATRQILPGDKWENTFMDVSPDGSLVLTVGRSGKVRIWDTTTGQRRSELASTVRDPAREVCLMAFSPDSRRVVLLPRDGNPSAPAVFDTATGKKLSSAKLGRGRGSGNWGAVSFSPDGSRVLATYSRSAWVWDAADGRELVELKAPEGEWLFKAAFSPDGTRIVTDSLKTTPRIWDARTGKQLAVLAGHEGRVWGVAYSSDGSLLVTVSEDRTARVWDAATAKELLTLKHDAQVMRAAFTPDGRHVLTVANDMARLWPVNPLLVAEQRRPRALSKAEKERFDIETEK
jgi:WD40 repeat protein